MYYDSDGLEPLPTINKSIPQDRGDGINYAKSLEGFPNGTTFLELVEKQHITVLAL